MTIRLTNSAVNNKSPNANVPNKKASLWEKTSIPGYTQAKEREKISMTRKKIWLALMVLGLLLTLYQVQTVLTEYGKYPITTNIMVEEAPRQFLPAITVCTYNRIKCTFLQRELNNCFAKNCSNLSDFCKLGLSSGCSLTMALANANNSQPVGFNKTCPDEAAKLEWSIKNSFNTSNIDDQELDDIFAAFDPEDRRKIGMNKELMVKICMATKQNCSQFFEIKTTNIVSRGNCFGFNQNGSIQVRPGPTEGITLEFYLARDEFIWHKLNNKEGLRVVLHQPREVPLIEELGVDVLPGTATSFSLHSKQIKRQPDPYPSKCVTSWNETLFTEEAFPIVKSRRYTQVGCTRFCLLEHLVFECDCIFDVYDDMNVRDLHREINVPPFDYCSMRNETQRKCIDEQYDRYNNEECRCQPSCNETIYEIQTSSLTWPSKIGWFYKSRELNVSSFLFDYKPINTSMLDDEALIAPIRKDIQENLLRLDFYFASGSRTIIQEDPVYPDFFSLLTNLGGALSLWMGISFIVVVEVLEVFIDSILKCIR